MIHVPSGAQFHRGMFYLIFHLLYSNIQNFLTIFEERFFCWKCVERQDRGWEGVSTQQTLRKQSIFFWRVSNSKLWTKMGEEFRLQWSYPWKVENPLGCFFCFQTKLAILQHLNGKAFFKTVQQSKNVVCWMEENRHLFVLYLTILVVSVTMGTGNIETGIKYLYKYTSSTYTST